VRQSANLWAIKLQLWRQLLRWLHYDTTDHIMDSMSLPVCCFARTNRCRRLREVSAYGYDEVARQKCFGLRVHARLSWPGVICDLELLPADVHDTVAAEMMLTGAKGQVLADRNYWKRVLRDCLAEQNLLLLVTFSTAKHEKHPWPRAQTRKRYRVETIFGQFVHRFKARQVWARDV
jgi:hypothetical protein